MEDSLFYSRNGLFAFDVWWLYHKSYLQQPFIETRISQLFFINLFLWQTWRLCRRSSRKITHFSTTFCDLPHHPPNNHSTSWRCQYIPHFASTPIHFCPETTNIPPPYRKSPSLLFWDVRRLSLQNESVPKFNFSRNRSKALIVKIVLKSEVNRPDIWTRVVRVVLLNE